jgi:hypothetical protein
MSVWRQDVVLVEAKGYGFCESDSRITRCYGTGDPSSFTVAASD